MSSKKIDKKYSQPLDASSKHSSKKDIDQIKKSKTEVVKDPPKEKSVKPEELKNFDAVSHFKENIIHFDKNCSDPIKDYSYYCFTCKHSVCNECGVYDHKEHLLIQRDNCLNYDNSFFNDISNTIEEGLNLDSKKSQIKKDISQSIKQLKEQLDIIEKEKLIEIDDIFKEVKNNYISFFNSQLRLSSHLSEDNIIAVRLNTACVNHHKLFSAPFTFGIDTVTCNTGGILDY